MDVEHLIDYLDTGLNMDTLREMDREDLYRLREMLHHWERIADSIYGERRQSSI
jgi:hypothetical protein